MLIPFASNPNGSSSCPPKKQPSDCSWQEYVDSLATGLGANIPSRTGAAPQSRGIHKMKWTQQEDAILEASVAALGTASWRRVAECIPSRTGKQCRERWLGHFAPDVTTDAWSAAEDAVLLDKYKECGRHWAQIRLSLPGRSTSAVKNRWNWLCRRDVPNQWTEFHELANGCSASETTEQRRKEEHNSIPNNKEALHSAAVGVWAGCNWEDGDLFD
jgi:hypothetical protein